MYEGLFRAPRQHSRAETNLVIHPTIARDVVAVIGGTGNVIGGHGGEVTHVKLPAK